jgi:hypothetical protein
MSWTAIAIGSAGEKSKPVKDIADACPTVWGSQDVLNACDNVERIKAVAPGSLK